MKRLILILLFVLFTPLMGQATEEKPAIGIETQYPEVGQPVQIFVSHASHPLEAFKVEAIYRPNSKVEKTVEVGRPNNNGFLEWTPVYAGLTVLQATATKLDDSKVIIKKEVSVSYKGFPPSGIFIFALAALTIFGGLFITVLKMGRPQAI